MSVPKTRSTKDKSKQLSDSLKSSWKALEVSGDDPGEIYGHSVVFYPSNEILIIFGGCSKLGTFHNNIHIFHLATQKWEIMETTGKRPKGRHFHAAVILDHHMYIFGDTWEWTEVEKSEGMPPSRRYGHTMVVYNRSFYVYGGYDDFGYKCNDMFEYRPMINQWNKVKTIGEAPERYHHSSVVHAGSMYLFGGSSTDPSKSSSLYEFRFCTKTWAVIPTLNKPPEGRWGHSSIVHDNQLYIIGGCDNILCFKDVHRLDLESCTWKKVKKISGFDPRYFGGCVVVDSKGIQSSLKSIQSSENQSSVHEVAAEPTNLSHKKRKVKKTDSEKEVSSPNDNAATTSSSSSNDTETAQLQQNNIPISRNGINPPSNSTPNHQVISVTVTPNPIIYHSPMMQNLHQNSPSSPHGSGSSSSNSHIPLPTVSSSPVAFSPTLGFGLKIIYHGGRNIHNWAFGDILFVNLESEESYNLFENQMRELVGQKEFADVFFIFPEETGSGPYGTISEDGFPVIYAHKSILATRCEPFGIMFKAGMMEANCGKIEIRDTSSKLFDFFLKYIYTGCLPIIENLEDIMSMLSLADKYFMNHLKSNCETLLKSYISSSNIAVLWQLAQSSHASILQRACISFVTRYSDALLSSEAKKTLPKSLVSEAKAKLSATNGP